MKTHSLRGGKGIRNQTKMPLISQRLSHSPALKMPAVQQSLVDDVIQIMKRNESALTLSLNRQLVNKILIHRYGSVD